MYVVEPLLYLNLNYFSKLGLQFNLNHETCKSLTVVVDYFSLPDSPLNIISGWRSHCNVGIFLLLITRVGHGHTFSLLYPLEVQLELYIHV